MAAVLKTAVPGRVPGVRIPPPPPAFARLFAASFGWARPGAAMALDDTLARRVAAMAADRDRGATELAREALDILQWAAEEGGVQSVPPAAAALVRARPAMPAIKNVINYAVANLPQTATPSEAVEACHRARAWLDEASRLAVEHAADLIPDDAVVVTCSYSSAVVQACQRAAAERSLRVRALASRASGVVYGERVAARLRPHHIACDVVGDDHMVDALAGATLVLVGSDRVLPDGALVNGSPTLGLAGAALDAGVAFYAICEAFKLDDEPLLETGFDLVPSRLVTGYATARGVVPAGEVWTR
jgi:translation initiation factor 2B subunit (eIF-2B alpha/beta/delta family)